MEREKCPVDVIAMYSAGGDIRPLRLRIEDDDQQMQRIDIDEIISMKEIPYVGVEAQIYQCRGQMWGKPCVFELKYMIRTHCWYWLRRLY